MIIVFLLSSTFYEGGRISASYLYQKVKQKAISEASISFKVEVNRRV